MTSSETQTELEWLRSASSSPQSSEWTGFAASVGSDSTWILHAIYENPQIPWDITSAELFRARLIERDKGPPSLLAEVQGLLSRANEIGFSDSRISDTTDEWRRLPWSNVLTHFGEEPEIHDVPCFRSFPSGDWPARLDGPEEGSMDKEQFVIMLETIGSEVGLNESCFYFSARLATGSFDDEHIVESTTLAGLRERFASAEEFEPQTPANVWPADHTWLTWTDWDLMGTRVSGPKSLVDRIRGEPALETTDLPSHVISWTSSNRV